MKFSNKKVIKILKREPYESKFLSPNIFKIKKKFFLCFSRRFKNKKDYGELRFAFSNNLKKWKIINNFYLTPNEISEKYNSLVSPSYFNKKKIHFFFIEAQSKSQSDILLLKTKDFIHWDIENKFLKSKKNYTYQSPHVYLKKNIFLFYSRNKKDIWLDIMNKRFQLIKTKKILSSSLKNEKLSIYSPSIVSFLNCYLMFYSGWSNKNRGNINLAYSNNLIKWKKIDFDLFQTDNKITIISEPYVFKFKDKLIIFVEYKNYSGWDLGYFSFNIKDIFEKINKNLNRK